MKLHIVAKNDKGVFLGYSSEYEYVILSLMNPDPLDLDDTLSSKTWDGFEEENEKEVVNLTKDCAVYIAIENWGCSRELGYEFLYSLCSPNEVISLDQFAPCFEGFTTYNEDVFQKRFVRQ